MTEIFPEKWTTNFWEQEVVDDPEENLRSRSSPWGLMFEVEEE
jgi:hypothetical protein